MKRMILEYTSGLMGNSIEGSGKTIRKMDWESILILITATMWATIAMISQMVLAHMCGLMEIFTKESGNVGRGQGMDILSGQIRVLILLDSLKKIILMVKGHFTMRMDHIIKVNLQGIREKV